MRKFTVLVLLAFAVSCLSASAFAASPWTEGATYGAKVKGKLDFAFKNTFGGWTELVTKPMDAHKNHANVFKGIGQGVVNAVVYTSGGLLHLVTFPITNLDVPLPNNGVSFSS